MKKIPTIFKRNPDNMRELLNEPHDSCAWVFEGEGFATRKYDGTCCLVLNGELYKRREIKEGKPFPDNFKIVDRDEITSKTIGWVPVCKDDKADRWHIEAIHPDLPDGTYELLGPKIQGNPENMPDHVLLQHKYATTYINVPRDYEGIQKWLSGKNIEGLVFHHPDGRMAKIKKRDFGQKRIKE